MSTATQGFLRGIVYSAVGGILAFVIAHLGTSGLVSSGTSVIIVGILASIEHAYFGSTATS